jgi:WD40 repeat protein
LQLPAGRGQKVQAHDGEVLDCAVASDGVLAASAGEDDEVKLWRLPDLAPVATLRSHQWSVISCNFGGDGNLLISVGGVDGTACLWDNRRPARRGTTVTRNWSRAAHSHRTVTLC